MLRTIEGVYQSYGFVPIDTPAVERLETLTIKGGNPKEIYALRRAFAEKGEDNKDFALRFDHTVPLARFLSQHNQELVFPGRFSQLGKVWRGERPQDGRFREFYQLDADIIGREKLSMVAEAELLNLIVDTFTKLDIGRVCTRLNSRKVLQGVVQAFSSSNENTELIIGALDRIKKVSTEKTIQSLLALGFTLKKVNDLLDFVSQDASPQTLLKQLKKLEEKSSNTILSQGIGELEALFKLIEGLDIPIESYQLDLCLARGLDYYTGTIYESHLVDHPDLGSICGGGRYADLCKNFTRSGAFPGVGVSIGLSRLFHRLLKAGIIKPDRKTTAQVVILPFGGRQVKSAFQFARILRKENLSVEVFTEADNKVKNMLTFANKKNFPVALIVDENSVSVRDMKTGTQESVNEERLIDAVNEILN